MNIFYTIDEIVRASQDPRLRRLAQSLARAAAMRDCIDQINRFTNPPEKTPVTPEDLNEFTEYTRRLALANDEAWRIIFEKIDRITNTVQEINETMPPQIMSYNWTKLAPDWRFDPKAELLLRPGTPHLGYHPTEHKLVFLGSGHDSYTLDELDKWDDMARDQLKRCRVEIPHWYAPAKRRLEKAGFSVEFKDGHLVATQPESTLYTGWSYRIPSVNKTMNPEDVEALNDAVRIAYSYDQSMQDGCADGGAMSVGYEPKPEQAPPSNASELDDLVLRTLKKRFVLARVERDSNLATYKAHGAEGSSVTIVAHPPEAPLFRGHALSPELTETALEAMRLVSAGTKLTQTAP